MPEVWTDSCVEFFCGHAGLPDGHYFNFERNDFVIFWDYHFWDSLSHSPARPLQPTRLTGCRLGPTCDSV